MEKHTWAKEVETESEGGSCGKKTEGQGTRRLEEEGVLEGTLRVPRGLK